MGCVGVPSLHIHVVDGLLAGNSFHEYRRVAPAGQTPDTAIGKISQKFDWLKDKVEDGVRGQGKAVTEKDDEISTDQKFNKLVWGEGPTGRRQGLVAMPH